MHFIKYNENPVLEPLASSLFNCPIKGALHWEEKDVFNPAAVVKDGEIKLLYRAEDTVGKYAGTSRIGLAHSSDGFRFRRSPEPVLYPDRDVFLANEEEGGCEDPRVVEAPEGSYIMTYTAFNGVLPQLFISQSEDLTHWDKKGYAFRKAAEEGRFPIDFRCKSGAILCKIEDSRMIAARVNGKYWMFWGEGVIYAATSNNLIDWAPVFNDGDHSSVSKRSTLRHMKWNGDPKLYTVLDGRRGHYDSWLVEPGPPPVLTEEGIVLLYNGASKNLLRRPRGMRYCAGRAVLDPANPLRVVSRDAEPFLVPDQPFEIEGQVGRVCFIEGLAYDRDAWFLYYGTADSKIAVAVSETLV